MKVIGSIMILFGYFMNANSEHFEVHSKIRGGACIMFDIDATFNLTYTNGKQTESSPLFSLKGSTVAKGSSKCGNEIIGSTSVLSVNLFPNKELLMFTFERQGGSVAMIARLTLDPRKHFKDLNTTGPVDLIDEKHLTVGPDTPNSYLCYAEEMMTFRSSNSKYFFMTMAVTNLHVQAYRIRNSAFDPAIECSQDLVSSTPETTSTVEPHSETTSTVPHSETTEPHSNTSPSEITTKPHPETTTHYQPNITTEPLPETTTKPPHSNSTTEPPHSNSTTEPPLETTTTNTQPETTSEPRYESTTSGRVETTTVMTPTTPEVPNTKHKYVVRDKKEVCIVLQGDIQFEIPFQTKDGTTATRNITIPEYVKVGGSCSYNGTGSAQEITLTFFNTSWVLDIVIARERLGLHENSVLQGTKDYSWQALRLTYVIDSNFPNAKNPGQKMQAVADGTFGKFKANTDGSYKCNAEQDLEFGKDNKMKMDLTKMQYRAFGKTNSTAFTETGVSECPADEKNNGKGGNHKTLGIALGVSLAGLVLIVVGACFVVRYRKKKAEELSYQSIQ